MKHLLTILALLCAASLSAQTIVRTVGITYTNGAPTHTPSSQGSEIVYDITNKDYYEYTGSGWNKVGEVVDLISGSAAPNPLYVPGPTDSRLVINASGELYFYNTATTAWQKISLNEPLASLTFSNNTAATSARRLQYNDDVGDFVFGGIGGVQLEATQKHVWYVRNAEATTLNAGEVVYAFGTLGNSGRITVKRFLADGSIPSKYVVGIVAAGIAAGQDGYVVDFGKIRGINTNAFLEGDILYPSATVAGQLTKTEPAAPNARMPIAFVVTKSANVGSIAVRLNGGGRLADIHDVAITTTPTNGQVLTYNDTTNVWRAVTPAPGITDLTFTGSASPFTLNSSTGSDAGFASGANIALSRTGDTMTIATALPITLKNTSEPSRDIIVATQTFDADTTNWTRGTGWTFNGTQAVATAATGDLTYSAPLTLVAGRRYEVTFTVASYSTGTIIVRVNNQNYSAPATFFNITTTVVISPTSSSGGFRISASSFTGNIDNVSVVEIDNLAPVLFQGEDDNSTTKYNELRMPNSSTLAFGGGGNATTGANNNFFGNSAGLSTTTGGNNNFFGASAGINLTTGLNNNFFGSQAGANARTGSGNNFFGQEAGQNAISGVNNNVFGFRTGQNNRGDNNNFFGSTAGQLNTTGFNNNFFGANAGQNNTTGSSNTFVGVAAGRSFSTGALNIAIGSNAGNASGVAAVTGGNNVFIGPSTAANITASAAAANVIIGNTIHLPIANGSNQLAISNLIFGLGAGGTGTTIPTGGRVGICLATPTATLHLRAGAAAASGAPLKFESGTNLTTPEAGAMEWNGTNLFLTTSTPTRQTINQGLTGSATLDFGNTNAGESADLTITVTGAADGDVVAIGVPNGSVNANTCYTAWVSAANTVTVRFNNYSGSAVDPASGTFKAFVTKF